MFAVCAEFISNPMRILCICVFMCALKCGVVLISFLIQITRALSPPHHTSSGHLGDYNCSRFGRHPRGASGAPQNCSHSFSTLCFFPPFSDMFLGVLRCELKWFLSFLSVDLRWLPNCVSFPFYWMPTSNSKFVFVFVDCLRQTMQMINAK